MATIYITEKRFNEEVMAVLNKNKFYLEIINPKVLAKKPKLGNGVSLWCIEGEERKPYHPDFAFSDKYLMSYASLGMFNVPTHIRGTVFIVRKKPWEASDKILAKDIFN